jgi:YD repeat-containing protein
LTEEQIADTVLGNRTITYTYDNVGNRLEKMDCTDARPCVSTTYAYDDNDRLTASTEEGVTTTYTYDDNGNMLTKTGNGETWHLTYNALNQVTGADITTPSGATSVEYVYDHDGIRVGKTVNGTDVTRYVVDKNRPYAQVLEEQRSSGTVTSYVYGDTLLSQATGPSTGSGQASIPHYYLYDGMHSVRGLADSAGTLTDAYTGACPEPAEGMPTEICLTIPAPRVILICIAASSSMRIWMRITCGHGIISRASDGF